MSFKSHNITRRPGETEEQFNNRLASFIAGFWTAQGRTVNAAVSRAMDDSTGMGWLPYRVQSDMKNGLPVNPSGHSGAPTHDRILQRDRQVCSAVASEPHQGKPDCTGGSR